eukprot:gene44507-64967_t
MGQFLMQLEKPHSKELLQWIRERYFRVQFEVLSEEDWGFENYFINAQQFLPMAKGILHQELAEGADYNNPEE